MKQIRYVHLGATLIAFLVALGFLIVPLAVQADHKQDPKTKNIHPLGDFDRDGDFGDQTVNSDIAPPLFSAEQPD